MVDHSLESLFWIRKEDMLIKYSLDRIGAQIKDKDAKFICYVFSNFSLNSKLSTLSKGGGMSRKLGTFFTFWHVFLMAPLREILSHLENIKSKIYENI